MKTTDTQILIQARDAGTLEAAFKALTTHCRRAARIEHPEGIWDNAGRFYPRGLDATVHMGVRSPSRAYPHSYMLRCRTLDHCELIYGADHGVVLALRRYLKAKDVDPCYAPTLDVFTVEPPAQRSAGHRKVGKPQTIKSEVQSVPVVAAEG